MLLLQLVVQPDPRCPNTSMKSIAFDQILPVLDFLNLHRRSGGDILILAIPAKCSILIQAKESLTTDQRYCMLHDCSKGWV